MSDELNGTYLAKATALQFGYSSKGTEQLGISFLLENGRHIAAYLYFSEAAADRSIESLRTMGWKGDDLFALTVEDLPEQVSLVIEPEEYEGKWTSKVKWINRAGGLNMADPMDDARRRQFAARMKARTRAVPGSSTNPRSGSGRAESQTGDDIPF